MLSLHRNCSYLPVRSVSREKPREYELLSISRSLTLSPSTGLVGPATSMLRQCVIGFPKDFAGIDDRDLLPVPVVSSIDRLFDTNQAPSCRMLGD